MRIAILSDIHGNTIALDAVLADVERQGGVDGCWILGDFVALGHDPIGVLERISLLPGLVCTRGNTDRYLATEERPFPAIGDAQSDPSLVTRIVEMNASFAWTQGAVTAAGWMDWLANLPLEFRTSLPDGTRFLGVHAAPGRDDDPGLYPTTTEADIDAALKSSDADLICVGHTHEAMDVWVNGRHLINLGSVSNPKAPDLRASYVLLTANNHGYKAQHHYVEYDRQAVLTALETIRHPGRVFLSQFMRGEIQSQK
ncbi:MAG: metallophosphoesterase family protein [Ardenticatenaceae bacterium]|nr:metallophosphoesterase family protein [Ardenticatenaceae bacterium]MCB9446207.1 metallophosphoesterase family protein [Ardenticatenaceae bacterium]